MSQFFPATQCLICKHEFSGQSHIYGYGVCTTCADPTGEIRRRRQKIKWQLFADNYKSRNVVPKETTNEE